MLNILEFSDQYCPVEVFKAWYEEASNNEELPDAFSLATSDKQGRVSNRYLNYKGIHSDNNNEHFFMFVGNFDSHKAKQIEENPNCAMNFFWRRTGRQVRIEGKCQRMPDSVCDELFHSRSELSRLASSISSQSSTLQDYPSLQKKFQNTREAIENNNQKSEHWLDLEKRPSNWGAFGVVPTLFEYFVYGDHRLNLRYQFEADSDNKWKTGWLYP
jgi:pyridoxamine 5'-phosphate oxidase